MKKIVLGQRNNNPLNIRKVPGTRWIGSLTPDLEPRRDREVAPLCGAAATSSRCSEAPVAPQGEGRFVRFVSIEFGLRAAYQILDTYKQKYHAVCIEDIITRWAPPSENDTEAYIRSVCTLTGFGGKERLTEAEWPALVKAMALIESRMHLDENVLKTAYNLYLNLKR